MSATTTAFAPSAANLRHSAAPIPFAPPVTTMTLSVTTKALSLRRLFFHPGLKSFDVLLYRPRRREQDDREDRREDRHDVHRRMEPVGPERLERLQIEAL